MLKDPLWDASSLSNNRSAKISERFKKAYSKSKSLRGRPDVGEAQGGC